MRSRDAVLDLILRIHTAAQEPAEWQRVLTEISDLGEGEALTIGRIDLIQGTPEVVSATRFPEEFFDLVRKFESPSEDLVMQTIRFMKEGNIFVAGDFFSKGEIEKTRCYQDIIKKIKLFLFYIRKLLTTKNETYAFMANYVCENKELEKSHRDFILKITNHVVLSLKTSIKLDISDAMRHDFMEILHYSQFGIILVDKNAKVLFVNNIAEKILTAADGLYIRRAKLAAERQDDTVKLEKLIKEASGLANGNPHLNAGGGIMLLPRPSFTRDFSVFVAPLVLRSEIRIGKYSPTVAVFVSDPERPSPARKMEELRILYGLTPAEVKVTVQMLEGQGMPHVAETMKLSLATVKTHQRAIFQKLDVKSQAQLVSCLRNA